jgi:zinc protease
MKKNLTLITLCFQTLLCFSQTTQIKYPEVDIPYKKFVLNNGLTLIVTEDHKIPMASFDIWYHVGSKNEKPGKTGFAHLFEHLMFTSTEHWKNFDEVMQTVGGGNNNGTTNNDRTNYFETFSTAGLDRVLWLEGDRMGYLVNGLDTTKVNVQRGVVQNEKRQGQNRPYAIGWDLTPPATYPAGHPYSWTVIGEMKDLDSASVDDIKEWFKTYYGPNNAIVCIAGDVNTDTVVAKVKKYFDDIPAGPPIHKYTSNIAKMKGISEQVAQDRVPQPRLQKTWNIPGWGTQDLTYLNLLADVLTNGKSSRLYKLLVYDKQLATDVAAFTDNKEIGGQLYILINAKPDADLQLINKLVDDELQKVFTGGVTTAEIERAKIN